MSDSLLLAITAGLGGMFGWGFADFFAKKTIDRIGDIQSLVLGHSVGAGLILAALTTHIFGEVNLPVNFSEWASLAFFGALQAVVYLLVYIGFGKGKLAILNPLFSSYSAIVALISIVFLGEVVTGSLFVGLGVAVAGILLISLDLGAPKLKKLKFSKIAGLKEIFTATVLAAIWTLLWADFVDGKDGKLYGGLMYVMMTFAIYLYAFARCVKVKLPSPNTWLYLAGIGVAEVAAYVALSIGFSETAHTSVVAVLSGAFSLPVILLSYLFLKEKVDRVHRLGSFVIVIGVVIILLSK